MNTLKQIIRIAIAAPVGYFTVEYYGIPGSFLAIFFYFAIYIAVSLVLEIIWSVFEKKQDSEKLKKL